MEGGTFKVQWAPPSIVQVLVLGADACTYYKVQKQNQTLYILVSTKFKYKVKSAKNTV